MSCDIFPSKLRYERLAVPVECSIACTPEHYSIVRLQFLPLPSPSRRQEILTKLFVRYPDTFPLWFGNSEISPREIAHFATTRQTKMISKPSNWHLVQLSTRPLSHPPHNSIFEPCSDAETMKSSLEICTKFAEVSFQHRWDATLPLKIIIL